MSLSPRMMNNSLWTICWLGVLLNVLVFRKYRSSRTRQSPSVRSSLRLLCVMAAADTLSLLALMLALSSKHLGRWRNQTNTTLVAVVCKLDLFLIHASSAFGIWCWLILSALRYMAIHHPYAHLRLHREPLLIVALVAVGCCLLESWILLDVTYIPAMRTCGETLPDGVGKVLQLFEILWTYFLPLSLIIVLDLKVLCCHSSFRLETPRATMVRSTTFDSALDGSLNSAAAPLSPSAQSPCPSSPFPNVRPHNSALMMARPPAGNTSRSRRRTQQLRILHRCLCISVIDLGMNLPNYLVRLYLTMVSEEQLDRMAQGHTFLWLQDISQLLYFAQFAMNALYLVAINYVLPSNRTKGAPNKVLLTATLSGQEQCAITPRKLLNTRAN